MANINIKVNGQFLAPAGMKVKQGGAWIDATGQIKINGAWQSFTNNSPKYLSSITSPIALGGGSTKPHNFRQIQGNYLYNFHFRSGETEPYLRKQNLLTGEMVYEVLTQGTRSRQFIQSMRVDDNYIYLFTTFDAFKYNVSNGSLSVQSPYDLDNGGVGEDKTFLTNTQIVWGERVHNKSNLLLLNAFSGVSYTSHHSDRMSDDIVLRSYDSIYYISNNGQTTKWSKSLTSIRNVAIRNKVVYVLRYTSGVMKMELYDTNGVLLLSKSITYLSSTVDVNLIEVDNSGNLLVFDTTTREINKFDLSGNRLYMSYLGTSSLKSYIVLMHYYNGNLSILSRDGNQYSSDYDVTYNVNTYQNI